MLVYESMIQQSEPQCITAANTNCCSNKFQRRLHRALNFVSRTLLGQQTQLDIWPDLLFRIKNSLDVTNFCQVIM